MNAKRENVRRPFTEWGLYLSVSVCLAATGFLIASARPGWPKPCLKLVDDFMHGGVYMQLHRGDLWFFGHPASGATGFLPPDLARIPLEPRGPLAPGQRPWQRRSLTLPGFAFHRVFYPTTNNYPEWSVKVSIALPAILSMLVAALLLHRLRRKISPTTAS